MIVKLSEVRLAFPQLFEARAVNGEGTPAFSASLIFAKDGINVKSLNDAFAEVALEKWGAKGQTILAQLRAGDKVCMHDGDAKTNYDGFEGNYFVSARNKVKPLVMDRDKTALQPADGRPYAGCYVNASVEIWAQDNKFGKRINATLRGVQFLKDGEAFAGGQPADEDEFDSIEGAEDGGLV